MKKLEMPLRKGDVDVKLLIKRVTADFKCNKLKLTGC